MAAIDKNNPLTGLLSPDPLADNPDARYWRDQALYYQAELRKALKADVKTRAQMRREYERPHELVLETVTQGLGLGAPFGLSVGLLRKRKPGRPKQKITGGLLCPEPIKKRPGRKLTWTPAKRKILLAGVEQLRADHPESGKRRVTDKELLTEVLEAKIGGKPRASEKRQFEKDLQRLQSQVSIARREQCDQQITK